MEKQRQMSEHAMQPHVSTAAFGTAVVAKEHITIELFQNRHGGSQSLPVEEDSMLELKNFAKPAPPVGFGVFHRLGKLGIVDPEGPGHHLHIPVGLGQDKHQAE